MSELDEMLVLVRDALRPVGFWCPHWGCYALECSLCAEAKLERAELAARLGKLDNSEHKPL